MATLTLLLTTCVQLESTQGCLRILCLLAMTGVQGMLATPHMGVCVCVCVSHPVNHTKNVVQQSLTCCDLFNVLLINEYNVSAPSSSSRGSPYEMSPSGYSSMYGAGMMGAYQQTASAYGPARGYADYSGREREKTDTRSSYHPYRR